MRAQASIRNLSRKKRLRPVADISELVSRERTERSPHEWLGLVLTHFASAEQAIGRLCIHVDLPIEKGSLSSLADLRRRLTEVENKRCNTLSNRIDRWCSHRPLRHLLAHSTIHELHNSAGELVIVTRHLPRDKDDVTPDRLWTQAERQELLRQATNDSRSIADQIRNILADSNLVHALKSV